MQMLVCHSACTCGVLHVQVMLSNAQVRSIVTTYDDAEVETLNASDPPGMVYCFTCTTLPKAALSASAAHLLNFDKGSFSRPIMSHMPSCNLVTLSRQRSIHFSRYSVSMQPRILRAALFIDSPELDAVNPFEKSLPQSKQKTSDQINQNFHIHMHTHLT